MTITAPSGPLNVGDILTLQCQVEISGAVDTPVDVSYTWKKSGTPKGGDSKTLSLLPVTTSIGGSYSCEATATPSGSTEFILPSDAGMDTTDVVVTGNAAHAWHDHMMDLLLHLASLIHCTSAHRYTMCISCK